MIGNPDAKSAQTSMAGLHGYYSIVSDVISQSPTGGCYKAHGGNFLSNFCSGM